MVEANDKNNRLVQFTQSVWVESPRIIEGLVHLDGLYFRAGRFDDAEGTLLALA